MVELILRDKISNEINGTRVINAVDAYFDFNITADILDDVDREYMKKYDGAIILDDSTGKIETPYGITDIANLSTGTKILLLSRHVNNCILNITESGRNIFKDLMHETQLNTSIKLFTLGSAVEMNDGDSININGNTFDDEISANDYIATVRGTI